MWDTLWPYLTAVLPTIVVATLFYFLMRSILTGDHRERLAQSRWEAEQDRLNSPSTATESTGGHSGKDGGAPDNE